MESVKSPPLGGYVAAEFQVVWYHSLGSNGLSILVLLFAHWLLQKYSNDDDSQIHIPPNTSLDLIYPERLDTVQISFLSPFEGLFERYINAALTRLHLLLNFQRIDASYDVPFLLVSVKPTKGSRKQDKTLTQSRKSR